MKVNFRHVFLVERNFRMFYCYKLTSFVPSSNVAFFRFLIFSKIWSFSKGLILYSSAIFRQLLTNFLSFMEFPFSLIIFFISLFHFSLPAAIPLSLSFGFLAGLGC